eukprot:tig00020723_g13510.t1
MCSSSRPCSDPRGCGKHFTRQDNLYKHVRQCRTKAPATPRSDPSFGDCDRFRHSTLLPDGRPRSCHVVEQLVLRIFSIPSGRSRPAVCCRFEHFFFFSTRRSRPVVEQLLMRIFFSAPRLCAGPGATCRSEAPPASSPAAPPAASASPPRRLLQLRRLQAMRRARRHLSLLPLYRPPPPSPAQPPGAAARLATPPARLSGLSSSLPPP